ncbi:hypothetical protein HK096_004995, partial [Nowakowskiella sp. JEL0078]
MYYQLQKYTSRCTLLKCTSKVFPSNLHCITHSYRRDASLARLHENIEIDDLSKAKLKSKIEKIDDITEKSDSKSKKLGFKRSKIHKKANTQMHWDNLKTILEHSKSISNDFSSFKISDINSALDCLIFSSEMLSRKVQVQKNYFNSIISVFEKSRIIPDEAFFSKALEIQFGFRDFEKFKTILESATIHNAFTEIKFAELRLQLAIIECDWNLMWTRLEEYRALDSTTDRPFLIAILSTDSSIDQNEFEKLLSAYFSMAENLVCDKTCLDGVFSRLVHDPTKVLPFQDSVLKRGVKLSVNSTAYVLQTLVKTGEYEQATKFLKEILEQKIPISKTLQDAAMTLFSNTKSEKELIMNFLKIAFFSNRTTSIINHFLPVMTLLHNVSSHELMDVMKTQYKPTNEFNIFMMNMFTLSLSENEYYSEVKKMIEEKFNLYDVIIRKIVLMPLHNEASKNTLSTLETLKSSSELSTDFFEKLVERYKIGSKDVKIRRSRLAGDLLSLMASLDSTYLETAIHRVKNIKDFEFDNVQIAKRLTGLGKK